AQAPRLDSNILPDVAAQAASAGSYRPILEQLGEIAHADEATQAPEARRLIGELEQWAAASLDRARELEPGNPGEAIEAYRTVYRAFPGLRWGDAAEARLGILAGDPRFRNELNAARQLEALRRVEARLREIPGASRSANDARFARANARALRKMRMIAE